MFICWGWNFTLKHHDTCFWNASFIGISVVCTFVFLEGFIRPKTLAIESQFLCVLVFYFILRYICIGVWRTFHSISFNNSLWYVTNSLGILCFNKLITIQYSPRWYLSVLPGKDQLVEGICSSFALIHYTPIYIYILYLCVQIYIWT